MCKMTVTTVIVISAAIAFITPSAHAQCTSTQLAAPIAGDAFAGDQFGRSVAVHESLAVVGAPEDDFGEGSAYLYEFDGAAWQQVAKLTASDGATGNKFGISVGVSGDVIVVGAYQPFPAEQPGKAYVFEQPIGGWVDMTETATLTASDGANNDNFGYAVDIDGTTIDPHSSVLPGQETHTAEEVVIGGQFLGRPTLEDSLEELARWLVDIRLEGPGRDQLGDAMHDDQNSTDGRDAPPQLAFGYSDLVDDVEVVVFLTNGIR